MKIRPQIVFTAAAALLVLAAAMSVSSQGAVDKGAANIELEGGKRGKVPFPHRQHQGKLDDCQICHAVFPQKAGSITALKSEGKLKKKYVMNKLCTKCHKQKKKAGLKSGPTTCKQCHIKA